MKRLHVLAACVCLGGAPALADEPVPPAPAGFVSDQTGLFTPERAAQISRAITELQRSTGASVYVATFSFLGTDSTRDHVLPLVSAWLGPRPGIVIAYNRGNGKPAIVPSPGLWEKYPTDDLSLMLSAAMNDLASVVLPPDERVSGAVSVVLDHLGRMEKARAARPGLMTPADAKLAGGLALVLALPGGLWWFLSARRRRREMADGGPWHFPEVQVGTRLGAPFGGGVVGSSEQSPP